MNDRSVLAVGAVIAIASLAACGGGGGEKQVTVNTTNMTTNTAGTTATTTTTKGPAPAATDTATVSGATLAQFPGQAAAGEAVFAQCRACHVTQAGQNRIGPSLHSIVGRQAGQVAGYTYSVANRDSGITWSPEKLFQYLENPQRVVPGTKMAFAGVRDPQQRSNLIAWLGTQNQ